MQKKKLSSEDLILNLFESIYFESFRKNKSPRWLKNDKGHQLRFDGYNEKYKIAVEHNGLQHYIFPNHFHGKDKSQFRTQQLNDKKKRELCKKKSITLIEIPQLSYSKQFIKKVRCKNKRKRGYHYENIYTTKYCTLLKFIKDSLPKKKITRELHNTYLSNKTIKKRSHYKTIKHRYGMNVAIALCSIVTLPIFLLWIKSYGT